VRRRGALVWGLAVALLAAATAACGDDDDTGGSLPAVEGTAAPEAYRIVYEVVTPDSTSQEERIVHRPFDAHVIERDADGDVTAERWSALGRLVTRSQGGEAVAIDTAIAPAASDVRPDLFTEPLEAAGKLKAGEAGRVSGRACRRAKEVGKVATAPDPSEGTQTGSLRVVIDRCVDALGLVLEERWTTPGGERVLTKRAVALDLGDDVPPVAVPDASKLPAEQGNGAVRELAADTRPPFAEAWSLPAPAGFTFVGRYAVQPARLTSSGAGVPGEADVALYTDVWERDGNLLLLDQGASRSGRPPFDPASAIGHVDLPGLGRAELAVDLRLAEVRLSRSGGGFVRLAGTLAPDDLAELAGTLQLQGGAP
jgi:hypothetical protein